MKKSMILILLCLMAAVMTAGCSKEEKKKTEKPRQEEQEKGGRVIVDNDSKMKEEPAENNKKGILIAIDPGHQSFDVDMSAQEPNAPGSLEMKAKASTGTAGKYSGIPEYQLAMDISLMLKGELEARGYDVLLTRENNETAISNSERAVLANESGAAMSVRIHANGSEDSSANGALALVPSGENPYVGNLSADSSRLAGEVLNAYCEATGMANRGVQENDTMTGINWSKIPVMILEMGFMSNEQDDRNMADSSFRGKMVMGIADGIDRYCAPGTDGAVSEELNGQIQAALSSMDGNGTFEVYAKRLGDGCFAQVGEGRMESASLIKLFTAACVYENLDEVKSQEGSEGGTEELLSDMISASDNEAANTLVLRLGHGDAEAGLQAVNDYCAAHGYQDTHMGRLMLDFDAGDDNYTSARDCTALLEQVYSGTMPGAQEMLEAMKRQERREKIPAAIAPEITVANKTGELPDVENDAAIVCAGDRAYILCVMSQGLSDAQAAREKIKELSGIVCDYMTK